MRQRSFRVFGVQFGRWGPPEESSPEKVRFEELAASADHAGVQWHDLLEEGYRAPGDLSFAGGRVRFDWEWRIGELQRRLDQRGD